MQMLYERPGLVTPLNGGVGYEKWDRGGAGGGGGGGGGGSGAAGPAGRDRERERERHRERERQARAHQMSHAHAAEPDASSLFPAPIRVTGHRDKVSQQIHTKLGDYHLAQTFIEDPAKSIGICAEPPSPAPCHPSRRESEFKKPAHAPQNGRVHGRHYAYNKNDGTSSAGPVHRPPPLRIPNGFQAQSAIDSSQPPIESILKEMKSIPTPLTVIAATPRKELENKFIFDPHTNKVQENPQLSKNDLKSPLPKPGLDNRISNSRSSVSPDVAPTKEVGLSESDDEVAAAPHRILPVPISPIGSGSPSSGSSSQSDSESESSSAESTAAAPPSTAAAAPAPAPSAPAQRSSWSLVNFAPPPPQPLDHYEAGKELRHALADVKGKPQSPISELSDSEASSPSPGSGRRRSLANRTSTTSSDDDTPPSHHTSSPRVPSSAAPIPTQKRGRPLKPRTEERAEHPAKKKRGRPKKARPPSPAPRAPSPAPDSDPEPEPQTHNALQETKTHIFRKVFTPARGRDEVGGKGGKGGKGKGGKGKGQVTIIEVERVETEEAARRHRHEEALARVSPPPERRHRRDRASIERAEHRRSDDRHDRPRRPSAERQDTKPPTLPKIERHEKSVDRLADKPIDRFADNKTVDRFADNKAVDRFADNKTVDRFADNKTVERFTDRKSMDRFTDRKSMDRFTDRKSMDRFTEKTIDRHADKPIDRFENKMSIERIPDKMSMERLTDSKAIDRLSDGKISMDRLVESKMDRLVDSKMSMDRLVDSKMSMDRLVDSKMSMDRLTDSKMSMDRLVDSKMSIDRLVESKMSIERVPDKAMDRLGDSKMSLIDNKMSIERLTDGKMLDRLSDNKALDRLTDSKLSIDRLSESKLTLGDRYVRAEADVGAGIKPGRGSERLEEASSIVSERRKSRVLVRVPLSRLRAETLRALQRPRRQPPAKRDARPEQLNSVVATNHERTGAAGQTPIYYSYFERLPTDALSDEERDHKYYLEEAIRLRAAAEREQEPLTRWMLYLESVLCFVLTGRVLELEQDTKGAFTVYRETIEYIKVIHTMPQRFRASPHDTFNKLDILGLRVQALLYLRMFKMYNREVKEYNKIVHEYQQKVVPPPMCAESASPLSPTPSPAGSVGSVGSGASASSGYCSLVHSVPAHAHQALLLLTKYYAFLYVAHDLWERADGLCRLKANQDLFIAVDRKCGPLSLSSTFRHLVQYVRFAISLLKNAPRE